MRSHVTEAIEAVERSAGEAWKAEYLRLARQFLEVTPIFEGGMLKAYCKRHGMPDPHSHNVWGAMVRGLSTSRGWSEKLGEVAPTTEHTHINLVGQWRSLIYKGSAPTYEMITSEAALNDLLDAIGTGHAALDFETTGLDPACCEVRLAQIYNDDVWAVIDFWSLPGKTFAAYADWFVGPTWGAFNAGFEWMWFEYLDLPQVKVVEIAHARRSIMGGDNMSLARMLKADLHYDMPKAQQISNWGAPELSEEQLTYAADDALWTWRLWRHWEDRLSSERPAAVRARDMLDALVAPVKEMKDTGLLLDIPRHRKLVTSWEEKRAVYEGIIRSYVDEDEIQNLRSRAQCSDYFASILPDDVLRRWPRTEKTGQLQITTAACQQIASLVGNEGPLADVLHAMSDLATINQYLSNFGDKLINIAEMSTDGRIHPSYNIARAVTGRFSSSGPNAQQLPRDRELLGDDTSVRSSFLAPPKKLLVSLDYSGIELKVLALLSGDEQLLHDCIEGDLHSEVASFMVGHQIDKKTAEGKGQRSTAKGVSFGIVYGSGAGGLSATLRTSVARAQELIAFWEDRYPKAFRYRYEMQRQAEATGYIEMVDGGSIYLTKRPDLPKCANYPVQRAALSIMARAIIRHHDRLISAADRGKHLGTRMAATIHDALIDEALIEDAAEDLVWMKADMVGGYLDIFPGAPTEALVEGGVGKSWGTLEEHAV